MLLFLSNSCQLKLLEFCGIWVTVSNTLQHQLPVRYFFFVGPGIVNGRIIRRSSTRSAGLGGRSAGAPVGCDDRDAALILLSGAASPQRVQQDGPLPNQQVQEGESARAGFEQGHRP